VIGRYKYFSILKVGIEQLSLQNNLTTNDSFNTKIYYLQKYMYNIIYLKKIGYSFRSMK